MGGKIAAVDIERVRSRSDLVEVASERLALERKSGRFWSLCPFHDEKSKSFSISPESGLYYCFGCGEGGDVFTFVERMDDSSFVEAVEKLAARSGIELTYSGESAADRNRRRMKPRLAEAMAAAVDFYCEVLRRDPDAAAARSYLASRGITKEIAARFRIGFAPDSWDAAARKLKSAGFREAEVSEAGIAKPGRRGSLVDHLRSRIIFPIFNADGDAVAVAGRVLPHAGSAKTERGDGPKYVNTPETPIYAKSRTLYALNWAKPHITERGEAVIVEGYTDVIGFHGQGVTNTVATCGTALGEDHLRLLKRWCSRVVLAFDGDTAGERATARVFEKAFELGLDVRVAVLPGGTDPAELASRGSDAVSAVLSTTRPLLEFAVERELARHPVDSVENEARALDAGLGVVARHPDPTVRANMARVVARQMRDVTEDVARRRVEQIRVDPARSGSSRPSQPAHAGSGVQLSAVDENALAALIQWPSDFLAFDVAGSDPAQWFVTAMARDIAMAIIDAARERSDGPIDLARCELSEGQRAIVQRLAVWEPPGIEGKHERFARETAQRLYVRYLEGRERELARACEAAEAAGDDAAAKALNSELVAFIQRRQELRVT